MEEEKVAQALFDYFGFNEFLTRDIPADVMDKLTGLMEIHEPAPARNIKGNYSVFYPNPWQSRYWPGSGNRGQTCT